MRFPWKSLMRKQLFRPSPNGRLILRENNGEISKFDHNADFESLEPFGLGCPAAASVSGNRAECKLAG